MQLTAGKIHFGYIDVDVSRAVAVCEGNTNSNFSAYKKSDPHHDGTKKQVLYVQYICVVLIIGFSTVYCMFSAAILIKLLPNIAIDIESTFKR